MGEPLPFPLLTPGALVPPSCQVLRDVRAIPGVNPALPGSSRLCLEMETQPRPGPMWSWEAGDRRLPEPDGPGGQDGGGGGRESSWEESWLSLCLRNPRNTGRRRGRASVPLSGSAGEGTHWGGANQPAPTSPAPSSAAAPEGSPSIPLPSCRHSRIEKALFPP